MLFCASACCQEAFYERVSTFWLNKFPTDGASKLSNYPILLESHSCHTSYYIVRCTPRLCDCPSISFRVKHTLKAPLVRSLRNYRVHPYRGMRLNTIPPCCCAELNRSRTSGRTGSHPRGIQQKPPAMMLQRFGFVGLAALSYTLMIMPGGVLAITTSTGECLPDLFADGDCDLANNAEECGKPKALAKQNALVTIGQSICWVNRIHSICEKYVCTLPGMCEHTRNGPINWMGKLDALFAKRCCCTLYAKNVCVLLCSPRIGPVNWMGTLDTPYADTVCLYSMQIS